MITGLLIAVLAGQVALGALFVWRARRIERALARLEHAVNNVRHQVGLLITEDHA